MGLEAISVPAVARPAGPERTTGVWACVAGLAWLGLITGVAAQWQAPTGVRPAADLGQWVLIGVALVLSGNLTVDVRHRGEIESFDLFEVALAPAIYLLAGDQVVLLVVTAKLISQLSLRMPVIKLAFNVAQWAACAGCGALAFAVLHEDAGRLPALAVAMIVVAGVNLLALAGLFAVLDGPGASRQLLTLPALRWSAATTSITTAAGVGVASASVDRSASLFLLVSLPVLLHVAGRGYALALADLERVHSLQAGTRALSAVPDVRLDPAPFLTEFARGCRGLGAELALFRDDGPGVDAYRYRDPSRPVTAHGGAGSILTRAILAESLPVHVVGQPRTAPGRPSGLLGRACARLPTGWPSPAGRPTGVDGPGEVGTTAGTERIAVALRAAGWRDCLAVAVEIDDRPVGMLAVYDRSGFSSLDRTDLAALSAFSREVSSALHRAALMDEVIGARLDAARIVESCTDGIATLAANGSVVTWNQALCDLTGHGRQEVTERGGLALLDPRDAFHAPVPWAAWARCDKLPKVLPDDLSVRTAAGDRRWLSCSLARTGNDGDLLVVIARDVTDLHRQRDLISGQSRIMELIAAGESLDSCLRAVGSLLADQLCAPVGVLLTGDGGEDSWRLAAHADPGLDPMGRAGAAGWTGPPIAVVARHLHEHGAAQDVPEYVDEAGDRWWVSAVHDQGESLVAVIVGRRPTPPDVEDFHAGQALRTACRLTEVALDRERARTRLTHQATHDPLTGLPNRALFLERCRSALRVASEREHLVVVLFVDLDRFKVINDSLGHDAGDRLLVAVAERLRHVVRPSDAVARFGGDEFTMLCEGIHTPSDARVLAGRLLDLFSEPFDLDGREVFETASVGISLGCAPRQPEDLLQEADAAMYRAKAEGGNRFNFFDEELRQQASERLSSYASLRRALEGRELVVHYQPTFSLADGSQVGMEALARWQHPTRGLLHPAAFMDLAEETGLIVPLGWQIFSTALTELTRLPSPGQGSRPPRMSVNLSARQLSHPDLVARVETTLRETGVSPSRLTLEITETVLVADSAAMRAVIGELKQTGVDLALDDFGTGHSSMDYLKFLPVDELKIDRRFVSGLLDEPRDRAIVSAITHLAHELGLRVVAEGIESRAQADLLREIGCDVGQGYFFARPAPMPAPDLLR